MNIKDMFVKQILPIALLILLNGISSNGQDVITLPEAIDYALKHNLELQSADLNVGYNEQLKKTAGEIPKTDIMLMHGQYNSYIKKDNNLTITQTLPFPTVWTSERALGKANVMGSEMEKEVAMNSVVYQVSSTFYQLLYLQERNALLAKQDSIYNNLLNAATVRYTTGESTLLEKFLPKHKHVKSKINTNKVKQTLQFN